MFVKTRRAGVDRSGVDGDFNAAFFSCCIKFNFAFFFVKTATVGRGVEVADFEGGEGVGWVKRVGGGVGLGGTCEKAAAAVRERLRFERI